MIGFWIDYASPSAIDSDASRAAIQLSANRRRPVRFSAKLAKDAKLTLRLALQTLGQLVWADDLWIPGRFYSRFLDPIITVHPDRVFFEAFSVDQSSYGMVIADLAAFEPSGDISYGTTNVDFTAWLWGALGELRSSRETTFNLAPEGFEVKTAGAGGRFEGKVDVPEPWIRGFLELQAAMAMPGTRLSVRPVDLLSAIRFLRATKAKVSPRALRYELEPGQDARLVLEPWEEVIRLRGAEHSYTEKRVIRTWGRRRLRAIEPLLPYAERVTVYLKGRAMPSFYSVDLGPVRFLLGLSGWTENRWTDDGGGLSLLLGGPRPDDAVLERAGAVLAERRSIGTRALAGAIGSPSSSDEPLAARALATLCRQGRAIYDVERREWRHRELFDPKEAKLDERRIFTKSERQIAAEKILKSGAVRIESTEVRERRKEKKLKTPDGAIVRDVILRDVEVKGSAGDQREVEIVVSDEGRLIFGRCGCESFREHHLSKGPCEHLLAMLTESEQHRRDLPTSEAAAEPEPAPKEPRDPRGDEEAGDDEGAEP